MPVVALNTKMNFGIQPAIAAAYAFCQAMRTNGGSTSK
jgi:hypothetical protein